VTYKGIVKARRSVQDRARARSGSGVHTTLQEALASSGDEGSGLALLRLWDARTVYPETSRPCCRPLTGQTSVRFAGIFDQEEKPCDLSLGYDDVQCLMRRDTVRAGSQRLPRQTAWSFVR
jgi:hypothetical protein